MKKIIVVNGGVITGIRHIEVADYFVLEDHVTVTEQVADLIEASLRQTFLEGAEAERDRSNAESELGEEVELVNPYGRF